MSKHTAEWYRDAFNRIESRLSAIWARHEHLRHVQSGARGMYIRAARLVLEASNDGYLRAHPYLKTLAMTPFRGVITNDQGVITVKGDANNELLATWNLWMRSALRSHAPACFDGFAGKYDIHDIKVDEEGERVVEDSRVKMVADDFDEGDWRSYLENEISSAADACRALADFVCDTEAGDGTDPVADETQSKRPPGEWLGKALMTIQDNPDWSNKRVAEHVGVHPATLGRSETYLKAVQYARDQGHNVPVGHRTLDADTGLGSIEAIADSD